MDDLIKKAEELKNEIKRNSRNIDNPALEMSTISALDLFIENVKEE